jgi:hypothetical protein
MHAGCQWRDTLTAHFHETIAAEHNAHAREHCAENGRRKRSRPGNPDQFAVEISMEEVQARQKARLATTESETLAALRYLNQAGSCGTRVPRHPRGESRQAKRNVSLLARAARNAEGAESNR